MDDREPPSGEPSEGRPSEQPPPEAAAAKPPIAAGAPGSDAAPAPEPLEPTSARFFAIFPAVMLPMFLAVVDQTIISAALPAIAGSLGDVERVSWVVIAYLVSTTIAAPIYGQLRDSFGSRRMMFIALTIFMASSLLCATAQSMLMLACARVLQGLGGGGLMTLSQALIGEAVQPRHFPDSDAPGMLVVDRARAGESPPRSVANGP